MPDLVVVGRIAGPYGVSGALRISSSTQPPENLLDYRPWMIGRAGTFQEIDLLSIRTHGDGFVATLRGIADREAARRLSGAEIAVPRSALPELDGDREYYWRDLIGLSVSNADGTALGTVESLLETGAHDVLVIVAGERRTLVPFADPFLLEVDPAGGFIRVDWQDPT
ncbi:MAG: ribosome maturation factor RimM [Pseudomonadales bacterium]